MLSFAPAFDTVSHDGVWKIMSKIGCPERLIYIVCHFHNGMQACVLDDRDLSVPFPVTNGEKQGCMLAPTLFSMMFPAMLTDAFQDTDPGINRYTRQGKLFNLRCLQVKKVHVARRHDFLFADDCALNAGSACDMQDSLELFATACNNFGLTISIKKTVMMQSASGEPYQEHTVTVNNQMLSAVDKFIYQEHQFMQHEY